MATLVLTTLGTALGGPIGGALGSIVGQSIDRNLFGPPVRRGPRLGDLSVQTSSYGTPIARIYGRMRVAGTVVWATDLREEEFVTGGGKGAAGAIGYAYSASFAVALSSRSAHSIGRIWADGKLLRGADGAFKTKVKHRFYPGNEVQTVDPLIASIEGVGGSPAFRGLALAVFEDMALADYGNRIPSLTFELIADGEAPRVDAVISDISGGVIEQGTDDRAIGGFAALGSDRHSALATLVDLWGKEYHDDGPKLRSAPVEEVVVAVGDARTAGCAVDGAAPGSQVEREQEAADALPSALTIEYYDPERDYQAGQMRATLSTGGRSQRRIDSASAMSADVAKSLASDALARRWAGRDRVTLRLAPSCMALRPGPIVAIAGGGGRFRVSAITLDGLVTVVEARRVPGGASSLVADPGRGNLDPDQAFGRSIPVLLDLPASGMAEAGAFGVTFAIGCDGRFKPTAAALQANGQPLASLRIEHAAMIGAATSVLAAGQATIVDGINSLDVQLSNPQALLYHADRAALAMGANAMLVGMEIVQFGRALALGGGCYRLSQLLRGRRGTEWAVPGHQAGERIVLLDPASLVPVRMDPAMIGAVVEVRAYGIADDEADPPTAALPANGESLRPMSPCHLNASMDGDWCILRWVPRRAEPGWSSGWADEGSTTGFAVTLRRGGGTIMTTTDVPQLAVPTSDLNALGSGPIEIEVIKQGILPSRPAMITLNA
jgi:hypothetical protein